MSEVGEEVQAQQETSQRRSSSTCVFEDLENKNCSEVPSLPESPLNKERNNLADSSAVSTVSINGDMCKICHCGGEANVSLIAPCYCSGSLKYVHQECLQRWIKSSDIKRCELCKYPFAMQAKVKPFCQWEKLDMTALERRKLFCSVTFHVVAITCVVWSLYVLIDRTAEEIRNGELQWPFWTKLVVVAIGFTGGLVFMYIQCKVYVHLCRKWKAYNRTIVVQDAPEGVHKPSDRQLTTPSTKGSNFITVNGSSHAESASSRRSSSAPSSTTPATAAPGVSPRDTEKTNAETQTALRGVAILENECGHAHSLGHTSEAIFFTECECNLKVVNNKTSEENAGRQLGSELLNSTHSTSTPNMLHSKMTSSAGHSGTNRPSNNPRKYSLSPVRKAPASPVVAAGAEAPLPGSPLDAFDTLKTTQANHHSTVLSPVKTSSAC